MLRRFSQRFEFWWLWIQNQLDVSGDVIMLFFTIVVMYKILHGGLDANGAAAYASAVACFAYSNKGKK